MKIQLKELECKQCGHKWKPRTERIHKCPNPKCQSVFWDVEPEKKGE